MGPSFDTYAAFVVLEGDLNIKRAEREALVDAALAARRSAANERPAGAAKPSLLRLLDAMRPLRGMIRPARP